jgi:DNA-binding protein
MAKLEAEEKAMRETLLPKVAVFGNNGNTEVRITANGQCLVLALEAAAVLKGLLAEKVQA